jgi:hypothetical protein
MGMKEDHPFNVQTEELFRLAPIDKIKENDLNNFSFTSNDLKN